MNAASFRPRLDAFVEANQCDGRHLLLHAHAPRWMVVNALGREVAHLCDGTRTVQEIAAGIARRWSQPLRQVEADVEVCVAQFAEAGFLPLQSMTPDRRPPTVDRRPASSGQMSVPRPALQQMKMSGQSAVAGRRSLFSGHAAGNPAPWRLHIYLTDACNLHCRHCGVADDGAGRAQLDASLVRHLIDQAIAAGAEGVVFSGGEPLLHPDFLALVTYAAARLKTLVATNATLLDDVIAETLVRSGATVQVSLDGPDAATHDRIRGTGTFDRTWQGIERLQRTGIGERLALNVTLMRSNIGRVAELVDLAGRRGIAGVRFSAVQRMGRAAGCWADLAPTPAQYAATYRYLYRRPPSATAISPGLLGLEPEPPDEGLWCGLGRTLLVDARGDIYPCGLFVGPQFRLGNIRHTSPAAALASPALAQLIGRCAQRRETIAECRACVWKHFCQGGCAGNVWLLRGTLDATDELCAIRRQLFAELLLECSDRQKTVSSCS